MAEMTIMHQFPPFSERPARYLWKVTPSSIVPYIVMPLDPDCDAAPPCAQAAHSTARANALTASKNLMTTLCDVANGDFDSSLAPDLAAKRRSRGTARCTRYFTSG